MGVEISGLPISTESFDDILQDMDAKITAHSAGNYISITNTESMYHALRNPAHFAYIRSANHSLCDGIGVVIAGYAWGVRVPRRNGPILMLHACDIGQKKGWKHYFYGGAEGVAELLEEKLLEKFPELQVVGKYCPPFRPLSDEEKQAVIDDIQRTQPDIVWVGLGLLKQEAWIAEWLDKLNVTWMVGVGAAFDYHAGTVPWAPKWMQAIGMEWLYRLIIQPRLRMKRYAWSFHFMFQSLFDGAVHQVRKLVGSTS
jgi:N-acetylglucosaminyldiphosphoundecaprenol N-acetyl-beta-D-mannosaminyltransferase